MSKTENRETDLNLVCQIRLGHKNAFTELYRNYYVELCNFALRFVESPDISEEIVQDVFLNIWRRRKEWSPQSPRSYLYKSVRNKALDLLKHRKVELKWEKVTKVREIQHIESPEQLYEDVELNLAVQKAIDQLPDRRKTIFLLSRDDELTYKEIATVLDLSVKTVETQMGRALKTLRQLLSNYL